MMLKDIEFIFMLVDIEVGESECNYSNLIT